MNRHTIIGLGLLAVLVFAGCVGRTPAWMSQTGTVLELDVDDIVITGPTQGSSSVPVFLNIPFGVNSYLDAEQAALKATDSDVLVDRTRYEGIEGIRIPWIGIILPGGQSDLVIVGSRTYYVQGIGAKFTQ